MIKELEKEMSSDMLNHQPFISGSNKNSKCPNDPHPQFSNITSVESSTFFNLTSQKLWLVRANVTE